MLPKHRPHQRRQRRPPASPSRCDGSPIPPRVIGRPTHLQNFTHGGQRQLGLWTVPALIAAYTSLYSCHRPKIANAFFKCRVRARRGGNSRFPIRGRRFKRSGDRAGTFKLFPLPTVEQIGSGQSQPLGNRSSRVAVQEHLHTASRRNSSVNSRRRFRPRRLQLSRLFVFIGGLASLVSILRVRLSVKIAQQLKWSMATASASFTETPQPSRHSILLLVIYFGPRRTTIAPSGSYVERVRGMFSTSRPDVGVEMGKESVSGRMGATTVSDWSWGNPRFRKRVAPL